MSIQSDGRDCSRCFSRFRNDTCRKSRLIRKITLYRIGSIKYLSLLYFTSLRVSQNFDRSSKNTPIYSKTISVMKFFEINNTFFFVQMHFTEQIINRIRLFIKIIYPRKRSYCFRRMSLGWFLSLANDRDYFYDYISLIVFSWSKFRSLECFEYYTFSIPNVTRMIFEISKYLSIKILFLRTKFKKNL